MKGLGTPRQRAGILLAVLGAACWLSFQVLGFPTDGYVLDLGTSGLPGPLFRAFVWNYATLGGAGALTVGLALAAFGGGRWFARIPRATDRVVLAFSGFAFLLAAFVHAVIMQGGQLTDDESCYRFMAELIASGRVTAPSPPDPVFFDRIFMINHGQMFSQYFLGWPALLALGSLVGAPGLVNSVLFAGTVPALYLVIRETLPLRWVTVALAVFVTAPLLYFNAATELSHTSTFFLFAWSHAAYVIGRRRPAEARWDALFGLLLAWAFWARPLVALALGLPLGLAWAFRRRPLRARLRGIGAFLLAVVPMAAGFLAVNRAQTGHFFVPAYQYQIEFAKLNDYWFSLWHYREELKVTGMRPGDWANTLESLESAGVRLTTDLFGWPLSWLFLPVALVGAVWRRALRLPAAMLLVYVASHSQIKSVGIDTFGPVHFTEIAWPAILLSVPGARWFGGVLAARLPRFAWLGFAPAGVIAASLFASASLYAPVRMRPLYAIAEDVTLPERVMEIANVHHAVVFSPRNFTPQCARTGPVGLRHFAFWRPNNDPDLKNDILWVNHLSVERDRWLMRHFPGRRGYWLGYQGCKPFLIPLEDLKPNTVPPGFVRTHLPTPKRPYSWGELYTERWKNPDGSLRPIPHPATGAGAGSK